LTVNLEVDETVNSNLLLFEQGVEAVDWDQLIAQINHHTQPAADGEQIPIVLVEGTMILNHRYSVIYVVFTSHTYTSV